jgi:enoyl-CoA hydratase/carnithine racemase
MADMSETLDKPQATQADEVLYEVADGVAVITLNRPERMNTISGPMLARLSELLLKANADKEVRAVILTATGRAFCAGLDLVDATQGSGIGSQNQAAAVSVDLDLRNAPPTVLFAMDKPTICALNGAAAGYGMDTALGCDIRIMAESAKLAPAFVKRGIVPAGRRRPRSSSPAAPCRPRRAWSSASPTRSCRTPSLCRGPARLPPRSPPTRRSPCSRPSG